MNQKFCTAHLALAKCYNLLLITFPDIYPIYSTAYTSVELWQSPQKFLIDDDDNVLDINSVVIKHFLSLKSISKKISSNYDFILEDCQHSNCAKSLSSFKDF